MSQLRVYDAPVARNTDPITSVLAGEDRIAREESEQAVIDALWFLRHDDPPTDAQIAAWVGNAWTPQRLRTARAQLVRKGQVEPAGRREHGSPTGRAAMTWKAVTW